jgi:hypothetical protein
MRKKEICLELVVTEANFLLLKVLVRKVPKLRKSLVINSAEESYKKTINKWTLLPFPNK